MEGRAACAHSISLKGAHTGGHEGRRDVSSCGNVPHCSTFVPPLRVSTTEPACSVVPPSSQGGLGRTELELSSCAQISVTTVARWKKTVAAWSKVMLSGIYWIADVRATQDTFLRTFPEDFRGLERILLERRGEAAEGA